MSGFRRHAAPIPSRQYFKPLPWKRQFNRPSFVSIAVVIQRSLYVNRGPESRIIPVPEPNAWTSRVISQSDTIEWTRKSVRPVELSHPGVSLLFENVLPKK